MHTKHRMLPPLLVATALLASPLGFAAETIPARLDLVAVDQTTIDFVYDGAFDVYHLVIGDPLEEVYGLQLELSGLDLVPPFQSNGNPVKPTPDFASVGDIVIPESFFVGGREGNLAFAMRAEQNENLLRAFVLGLGEPLFASAGDATYAQTVAVLVTPAGSPKPSLQGVLGAAWTPSGSAVRSPDFNGDGNVDLLDLDILHSEFDPFGVEPPPPDGVQLASDLNDDGVVDGRDAVGFAATNRFFIGLPQATDAIPTPIAINPTFTVPGPFDLLDLDTLGANFGATRATVGQRDLNGDQTVDLLDLDLLGSEYQGGNALAPEPSSLLLLAVVGISIAAQQRPPSTLYVRRSTIE